MKKNIKSLSEHNAQVTARQWRMNDPLPIFNGIACPLCAEELYDTNPTTILTSIPAQKNVHCSKCDYVGYRIV